MKELPDINKESGEYIDSAGFGEYGIYGLTKERAEEMLKFFEKQGADVKMEKSDVIEGTYIVFFH